MQDDISALREQVDIITVSMHIGLVHVPDGKLADYERPQAEFRWVDDRVLFLGPD